MNELESLKALLDKEVSRRDFLMHIGLTILAVVGISSLLKNLTGSVGNNIIQKPEINNGSYGWNTYSGAKPKNQSFLAK